MMPNGEHEDDAQAVGALRRYLAPDVHVDVGRRWTRQGDEWTYRVPNSVLVGVMRGRARIGAFEVERAKLRELAALTSAWQDARGEWVAYDGAGEHVPVWVNTIAFRPLHYYATGSWWRTLVDESDKMLASHLAARVGTRIVPAAGGRFDRWEHITTIETGLAEPFGVVLRVDETLYAMLARRLLVLTRLAPPRHAAQLPMLIHGRGVQPKGGTEAATTPCGVAIDLAGSLCLEAAAAGCAAVWP